MKIKNELINLIHIIFGGVLLAAGVSFFILPGEIATGGTPGIAILLHHLTNLPTGFLVVAVNIPLYIAGIKMLGKGFAVRTTIAILLMSALIDLFSQFDFAGQITESTMLATLYGGILVGGGVGLILKGNASAGGSTIVARLISSRTSITSGQVIMFIDLLIIVSSGFIFNDIEKALWSLISIYVTGKIIDMVLSGASTSRVVHIATEKAPELSEQLMIQLHLQGSIMKGTGLHSDEEKTIIFLVVESRRLGVLRSLIREIDPEAFMVVMEARELQGRGHGV